MEEGVFVAWLKKDGEFVKAGDPLFTLENEKSALDVESTDNGVLKIPPDGPKSGDTVKVGARLGQLITEKAAAPGS
jgi:pyruvate dehydrogenase E2 component (dihydrolipoamide acetyltransferase)